jgi:hypothetical protein
MSIRPLDLLDLPTLHRYRNEVMGFDTARSLTHGNPLSCVGVMSHLVSASRDVYGAVAELDGARLLGGVNRVRGAHFARLLYLAPASGLDHRELPALLENLVTEAGKWGAFHVVAEVDEDHPAFTSLREAGFSVYAWQRMWDVSELAARPEQETWERAASIHLPAIQSLHQQIVPPLLQPVEQAPRHPSGYVCGPEVRCHAGYTAGGYGIVLNPLIHPEAQRVDAKLLGLVQSLRERRRRRVYICVRSYQAWLENVLADLGAQVGPRQALMVKHLARLVKDEQAVRAKQPAGVSVQASRVSRMDAKD